MSAAIPCTRATASRVAFRTARCKRFSSTETVAVTASPEPAIMSRPAEKEGRPLRFTEKVHKALYPQFYSGKRAVPKEDTRFWASKRPIRTKLSEELHTEKGVIPRLSARLNIPVFAPSAPNIKKTCPNPIAVVRASQASILDPTGARTRLFAKDNPECARVGDILLVRQRTGDPFAGVCINIRRRGTDTAILLRGQLTRVGVEMWYKIYSPLVEGIEVVQRAAKRARRARLTYMRTVKHDKGSVENVVRMYLRQKQALGTSEGGKKKGAPPAMGGKKGKGRGKKR
ncbi:hypothetical protein P153DRAFT_299929 [Dothidotthia symphoricarpi CBS 119687]|uniref:Mitochondrial ribosomal protein-like protein n=1 Tax=Dothidotthia symphoricarpi CBS 119687 TaxID=1392245 RepID=A0A6A6A1Z7_9PLEO|nr:uncharacterized protein P153DRAFT_299929 [Dothidotthia symphoricarpi CBS 119687]KAF2125556.1 hypothetical protein P153DRAFT_299929 [Dothidotthia symphoricarpi CBS 119687]